jgi:hypothetical protein
LRPGCAALLDSSSYDSGGGTQREIASENGGRSELSRGWLLE